MKHTFIFFPSLQLLCENHIFCIIFFKVCSVSLFKILFLPGIQVTSPTTCWFLNPNYHRHLEVGLFLDFVFVMLFVLKLFEIQYTSIFSCLHHEEVQRGAQSRIPSTTALKTKTLTQLLNCIRKFSLRIKKIKSFCPDKPS